MKTNKETAESGDSYPLEWPRTLDEVDEHLQVSDLGLQLIHQLLFDPAWVHDLSDGGVHPPPQLLGRRVPDVLVQVHVQLLDQLVNDDLKIVKAG